MEEELIKLQDQKAVQIDNHSVMEKIISKQFDGAEDLKHLLNRQKEIDIALNDTSIEVEIISEENIEMEA